VTAGEITRIEQDWTVVVGNPDAATGSPQIAVQMKPDANADYGCLFLLNYADQPSFTSGGTQLQGWDGTTLQKSQSYGSEALGKNQNERVTFTLHMEVKNDRLDFGFDNLKSWTWGNKSALAVNVPYSMRYLNGYSTADSVNNSVIMVGSAKVTSMTITAVRFYDNKGKLVKTDLSTPVYPTP